MRQGFRYILPLILGMAALVLTGCGVQLPDLFSQSAKEWYEMGLHYFYERGDYKTAAVCFENATIYPGNLTYIDDSQFYLGKSYFKQGMYIDAQVIFEDLATSFPNSPYADDARFYVGRCYLERSPDFERDSSMLERAIREFNRTIRLFPGSDLIPEIEAAIAEAREIQAHKLDNIIYLYRRMRRHRSVILYADLLLANHGDSVHVPATLWRRGEAHRALGDTVAAYEDFRRILDEYPHHSSAADARSSIRSLGLGEVATTTVDESS